MGGIVSGGEVMAEDTKREKQSELLKGNTLRVYLHLLKHGESELREVQRGLGLSSPPLASYHLHRLVEAGYAEQTAEGKYRTARDVSPEVLEGYSKVGVAVVPQLFFFSLLLTLLLVFFLYETLASALFFPAFVAVAAASVITLWYETVRLWRRLTTWE
jgi:SOS-response transcriptional repressor LexA